MKKFIFTMLILVFCVSFACADTVWVLCRPDSFVNVRPFANKKQEPNGRLECGWAAETSGSTKNGYLYLILSNEAGYGWIHKGYVVDTEPIVATFETNICSNGRVACFQYIGGKRRCWVKKNECVTVYATSEEWAVTNKGYIKTQYLGVEYDLLMENLAAAENYGESTELYWDDD